MSAHPDTRLNVSGSCSSSAILHLVSLGDLRYLHVVLVELSNLEIRQSAAVWFVQGKVRKDDFHSIIIGSVFLRTGRVT